MKEVPSEFPRRLRELRESAGMRRNHLDRAASLSAGHVSDLERGRCSPTLDTLRKLTRALGQSSLACWD